MDKNIFAAVGLCAAIFLLWQHFYLKPISDRQAQTPSVASSSPQPQSSVSPPVPSSEVRPQLTSQSVQISQSHELILGDSKSSYFVTLDLRGGTIRSIQFDEYKKRKPGPVATLIGGARELELAIPAQEWAYLPNVPYRVESKSAESATLAFDDNRVSIRRNYRLNPTVFNVDHDLNVQFKQGSPPSYFFVGVQAYKSVPKDISENERREIAFYKTSGRTKWDVSGLDAVKEDIGEGLWVGFSSRYFLSALLDRDTALRPQLQLRPIEEGQVAASLIYRPQGPNFHVRQTFYYGPKEIDLLKQVGNHLDMAVDFGWFTFLAYPLLEMLKWLYRFVHNYGIAIILLTIFVKVLTYPLTYKSMKSMKEMQRIQPQIQKLRDRYKDDKERLNREMLQLMRANGYNPMSGCFPIFIQMPIFIALYNVLYGAIDLYGAPFFGWIADLSAKDPFFVTPVLLGALMFLQQKMTPTTAADPAQQKMMTFMPLIFSFMMLWLPAGLTLYMLINSVTSILQQLWINRKLGTGTPRHPVVVT